MRRKAQVQATVVGGTVEEEIESGKDIVVVRRMLLDSTSSS
jgi:hypothetical protein